MFTGVLKYASRQRIWSMSTSFIRTDECCKWKVKQNNLTFFCDHSIEEAAIPQVNVFSCFVFTVIITYLQPILVFHETLAIIYNKQCIDWIDHLPLTRKAVPLPIYSVPKYAVLYSSKKTNFPGSGKISWMLQTCSFVPSWESWLFLANKTGICYKR